MSRRRRRIVGTLLAVSGTGFLALVGLVVWIYVSTAVPTPDQLGLAQRSAITFSDGSTLATLGSQNRVSVPLSSVPQSVRDAVLAAEDHNFYKESGISVRGIARAVYVDLKGGGVLQGGSTITQQYAKNAYLTQDRTFTRKFREIVLAVKLDHKYSKDQILGFYLNTIYFGRGAFGIETAAEVYFGHTASRLTIQEGAELAGQIRGPSLYDAGLHPQASRTRYAEVTKAMVAAGTMTPAQAAVPEPTPRAVSSGSSGLRPDLAYLRDAVIQELAAHNISEAAISREGLVIHTTIDKNAENAAWNAASTTMSGTPRDLQIGLSAIDPSTGAVRASVGGLVYQPSGAGADVTDNEFGSDVQPGSTFKTVVLADALSHGWSLSSVYSGASPKVLPGTSYTSSNPLKNDVGDPAFGNVTLTTALAQSVNTVFVPLGMQVGDSDVADLAHAMGISTSTQLDPQPSLALGTSPVKPIDVTSVYATVASGGTEHDPYLVQTVLDNSRHTIYKHADASARAIDSGVAADATSALQSVITSGTGSHATLADGRPLAGKTGTTATSALMAGFTPQLAASVAIFYEDNRPLTGIAGLAEVYGATLPAAALKSFMDAALQGKPVQQFPSPPHAGAAKTDICPAPYGTTFVTVPGSPDCTTHAYVPPTSSPTPSFSPTPSRTPSASPTPTQTPSLEPTTASPTPTVTPSLPLPTTASPTPSPSLTPSASASATP